MNGQTYRARLTGDPPIDAVDNSVTPANMNIVIITPGFNADERDLPIAGLSGFLRRLRRHHQVTVIALNYPRGVRHYRIGNVPVLALGGVHPLHKLVLCAARLNALNAAKPIDLIHGFFAGRSGAFAALLAFLIGKPLFVTVMGGELIAAPTLRYGGRLSLLTRICNAYALSRACEIISLSTYAARLVPTRHRHKHRVIPFGVDPAEFTPDGDTACLPGDFRLLSVGSLVPVKRHTMLLDAVARLSHIEGLALHIAGSGELEDELRRHAARAGIEDRVHFHGRVSPHVLACLYRGSDLLIVTSYHETESMVALEAAMCGCPVIGTPVGVLPDILAPRRLFERDNVDGLVDAIESAWRERHRRNDIGQALRRGVLSRFDLDTQVAGVERRYQGTIDRRGKACASL